MSLLELSPCVQLSQLLCSKIRRTVPNFPGREVTQKVVVFLLSWLSGLQKLQTDAAIDHSSLQDRGIISDRREYSSREGQASSVSNFGSFLEVHLKLSSPNRQCKLQCVMRGYKLQSRISSCEHTRGTIAGLWL